MTIITETRNYTVNKLQIGTEITDRVTGNTVHLHPGNGEWALISKLERLEEDHGTLGSACYLVDIIVEQYFV